MTRPTWRALAIAAVWLSAAGRPAGAASLDDLSYGPDPRQVLDLKLPSRGGAPAPVLVYFHGGAFVGGDKRPCAPAFVAMLAARNIAMACVDYRLAPGATYPAPMRDGARAVQWLRAHAAQYGLDPSRVALFGMSAGAGIALWIAMHGDLADPASPDPVLRQSTAVSAVVAGNAQATYDPAEIATLLRTHRYPKFLADLYGAGSVSALSSPRFAAVERDASPIRNMHAGEPPILAFYVSRDDPGALAPESSPPDYIHHPAQGALLAEAGRRTGADVTVRTGATYPGGWRGFLDEATGFLAGVFGT